jgi:hypothetical protein
VSGETANGPPPETGEDFPDDGDEGPIVLPFGASCKKCAYSDTIRIQGNIQSVRICRRHPPSAYFIPTPQGGSVMSSPPQVPDDYVCFEYDEREAPEIIPTGLG